MSVAFLGLGSNIEAEKNMCEAISTLCEQSENVRISTLYRSPAYGFSGDDFINGVVQIDTALTPLGLKNYLAGMETAAGRLREGPRFSDRTLDIDILLYDDLHLLSPVLEIPREEILEMDYILRPLAELAPERIHPVRRKTLGDLWSEFPGKNPALQKIDLPLPGP